MASAGYLMPDLTYLYFACSLDLDNQTHNKSRGTAGALAGA